MTTSRTYYKFYIEKNNQLKLPRFVVFGHRNGDTIFSFDDNIYNMNVYGVTHKEELSFSPSLVINNSNKFIDEMLRNGFAVEIVTDLWADWEFDESNKPIKRTVSPVNGVENRRAVWRPCYQYFSESERKYITDDSGTFDKWGDAFLESYHYYNSIKDKIYKGGFV